MDEKLLVAPSYFRAHGLGNDYLVFEASDAGVELQDGGVWLATPGAIQEVCRRNWGVGSDGIVVLLERAPHDGVFPLRMFNPDGSEFERSGNGLRVLAAHLFRGGLVVTKPFRVRSGGSVISMTVHGSIDPGRYDISVNMGRAQVGGEGIALDESQLDTEGGIRHPSLGSIAFTPVSVGNPHAVIFADGFPEGTDLDALLHEVGPFLVSHLAFEKGTNVHIVEVMDRNRIAIRIWERGVGRTSASGTSSCAAAVGAVVTGRIDPGAIQVEMEGGHLQVSVAPDLQVELRGPVGEISEGRLTRGFLAGLSATRTRSAPA